MRLPTQLALTGLAALVAAPALVAQQPATSGQPEAKAKQERRICRRIEEIGSIARTRRECRTRAEWDLIAERQRANSPTMTAMTGSQSGQ